MKRHLILLLGCLTIATVFVLPGSAAAQGGKTFEARAAFLETMLPPLIEGYPEECTTIGMTTEAGRDRGPETPEVHLSIGIWDHCRQNIELAAQDIGTATGSSTALMDDAFRVAPNLKTAWLAATVPLCDLEGQFDRPPEFRTCPNPAHFLVVVDITWTATGPRIRQENGSVCRAARADATISLQGVSLSPLEYTFQTTESASLCRSTPAATPPGQ